MISPLSAGDAQRFRGFLRDQQYGWDAIVRASDGSTPVFPDPNRLALASEFLGEPTPLSTLLRLFYLGTAVAGDVVAQQLPDWFLHLAQAHGLAASRGGQVVPLALLLPHEQWLIASDCLSRMQGSEAYDFVTPLSFPGRELIRATVRRPCRAALDLCCGMGVQGIIAAMHSESVAAVDLNARAIAFAEFNARLNGVGNMTCAAGDRFAPVQGRTFDLIVCHPPFVLAPAAGYLFRDSQMRLDQFCLGLLQEAPLFLEEGGFFQMIFEWAECEGEPWAQRLEAALQGLGCDAWVVRLNTHEPASYARQRVREVAEASGYERRASYDAWVRFFRDQRVVAVHGGMAFLRRRSGRNWLQLQDCAESPCQPSGATVERGFALRDFLAGHPDDDSLGPVRFRVARDTRLVQNSILQEGAWQTEKVLLRREDAIPQSTGVQHDVALFLGRFDGRRRFQDILDDMCRAVGQAPDRVRAECVRVARTMVERGYLLPETVAGD